MHLIKIALVSAWALYGSTMLHVVAIFRFGNLLWNLRTPNQKENVKLRVCFPKSEPWGPYSTFNERIPGHLSALLAVAQSIACTFPGPPGLRSPCSLDDELLLSGLPCSPCSSSKPCFSSLVPSRGMDSSACGVSFLEASPNFLAKPSTSHMKQSDFTFSKTSAAHLPSPSPCGPYLPLPVTQ